MPVTQASIKITNLRLRTYIGFNPDERAKKQDVVINVEIHYPVSAECLADKVAAALDYKGITKKIIQHVEEGQFLLLEKLVGDVLSICIEPEAARYAQVTIDKPHALRFADSVSLSLSHQKT